jgi:hypothetical protein
MREVAQIISTAGGNALNFPASDGTAEVGEIVAENIGASALDISFGTLCRDVHKDPYAQCPVMNSFGSVGDGHHCEQSNLTVC